MNLNDMELQVINGIELRVERNLQHAERFSETHQLAWRATIFRYRRNGRSAYAGVFILRMKGYFKWKLVEASLPELTKCLANMHLRDYTTLPGEWRIEKLNKPDGELQRAVEVLEKIEYSSDGFVKRYPEEAEYTAALAVIKKKFKI